MKDLKRGYCAALMDPSRKSAFDSLIKTWSSEQGAMGYAKIPSVLDIMLLTAVIDNRKCILELSDRFKDIQFKMKKLGYFNT
jgi:hypothetical protein